jgi:phthiocerol/phenolphthiocerol synthesis type-I polyketide synthase A
MTSWDDEADLRNWLVDYLVTNIGRSPEKIDLDAPLNALGVGSRDAVVLAGELSEMLGRPVSPVDFWENPTINTLAHGLLNPDTEPAPGSVPGVGERGSLDEPIAVVGLGCRLPGGIHGPDAFWQFLVEGRSAVGTVPDERWQMFDDGSAEVGAVLARTTRWGSFLDEVAAFDAEYFDISPSEADRIDPQQRLMLEVAVEALEHAGIPPESLRRTQTGVFAGACVSEYGFLAARELGRIDPWTWTGGALSIIANRLSYFLDVRGPSITVDTACSSSLVAIHLAGKSLRTGESDLALAAGVNLVLSPIVTRSLDAAEAMSQSGACRAFDAGADGFVRGEGCGVVVLKRLSEALRDGNRVMAVMRGSAINQDGRSNGLMAPNPAAQTAVLRAACADAGVEPREVDYVEAHGTGTLLGDPIEARGLGSVYGRGRAPDSPLLIGSVKTNVGHLEAAAGVAGFIKATLAVQRGRIPANLHFDAPNPHIPFEELGLRVVDEPTNWPSTGRPRRAGLSSFGFGGTNAHLVLEQAPAPVSPRLRLADSPVTTLVVAGKTLQRVARWAGALADWMEGAGAVVPLADIAHTVNHHRSRQGSFATVAARTRDQAVAGLRALAAGQSAPGVVEPHHGPCSPGVVFVYSGQGSQWAGMGRQLLADEPAFATAVAELEPEFVAQNGFSLKQVLADGEPLVGIDRIQPVLVAVQLALTALWRSYGIEPDAVIGHSMGEVTAAVVSGALSAADGLRVVATRSRLMARLSGRGAMALVELDPQSAEDLVGVDDELTVAVNASPRQSVIAGPPAKIGAVIADLQAKGRLARLVDIEVASHHPMIDSVLPDLRAALADLMPGFPTIPVITTTSGRLGTPTFDADYWADNLRNPVRFTQAVTDAAQRHGTFIEVSPHPLLTYAVDDTVSPAHRHSIGTLQRGADDTLAFHTNLNAAHTMHPPQTPHLPEPHPPLPSAPWLHTDHWISAGPDRSHADPGRFVQRIAWLPRRVDEIGVPPVGASVAVVGPEADANARVRELLGERGHQAGTPSDARYVLYVAGDQPPAGSRSDVDAAVRISDEVTTLVRQLIDRHDRHPAKLWILTHGVLEAVGSSVLPQSCLWGLAGVIAAEQPQIWGGLVDLPAAFTPQEWLPVLAEQLSTKNNSVLVLRDGEVRVPQLVPVDGQPVRPALRCRPDAAYLITGGLGALGLPMANWLADRGARRLVLAGRTTLPPRLQWENVTDPVTADRIAAIRTLEARGVAVDAVALDVAVPHAVQALLDRRDAGGAPPIRGVIHAAGVTRDQLLTGLDIDALRAVMSPKVAGAQALDVAFPPESVDFFFLISSAATLFGIPGQGSYACANAYLDALARSRQRRGGHTLSIDWVAWRGLGLAADAPMVAAELERLGSRPVEPDEAFAAWEHVAAYDVSQAVVIPVADGQHPNEVNGRPAPAPTRDWSQLSAAEVYRELSDDLRAILARELRLGEHELQIERSFADLGLSSLMAMSIRREAELLVGVELSATMLWHHPTVAALAAYLADKVASQADSNDVAEQTNDADTDIGVLAQLFNSVEAGALSEEDKPL